MICLFHDWEEMYYIQVPATLSTLFDGVQRRIFSIPTMRKCTKCGKVQFTKSWSCFDNKFLSDFRQEAKVKFGKTLNRQIQSYIQQYGDDEE